MEPAMRRAGGRSFSALLAVLLLAACGAPQAAQAARALSGCGGRSSIASSITSSASTAATTAAVLAHHANGTGAAAASRRLLQGGAITVSRPGGRLWLLYPSAGADFNGARQACQAQGGDLLALQDSSDQNALTGVIGGAAMWVGLLARNLAATSNTADFVWILTGQGVSGGVTWHSGEPTGPGGGEGVCCIVWDYSLGDNPCGVTNPYGCEVKVCATAPATQANAQDFAISLPARPTANVVAGCSAGYHGSVTATCGSNSAWTYSGACVEDPCDGAPVTQDGAVAFAATPLPAPPATALTAACDAGYSGYGRTATCHRGAWNYTGACAKDALGNSDVCLATIPKCEAGACASRNVRGVAKPVCLRCMANYVSVLDDSGNIVQCVCPKGFYEQSPASATSCTRCPVSSFCEGGELVENPLTRGDLQPCGNDLVTRSSGSRSRADCVAPGGYAMASPFGALPCPEGSYAPPYNRLTKCIKCASGLAENPALNLTAMLRSSKRAVCKVPPGRYSDTGLVRTCPQGFYREDYVDYDDKLATKCLPCNPGITTDGAGAGNASLCNVVLPGYGIDVVLNVTGPSSVPTLPFSATAGLPPATVCNHGFYSIGGYCAQCPYAAATQNKGSLAVEACMVPPGYVIRAGATTMSLCDNGEYRPGWVMTTDPKATACRLCGENILSEPRNLDENPMVPNGTLVRATSDCCYIDAGMGMVATSATTFVGQSCPVNTYGAAGRVYGLTGAACKPCSRNLVTDGASRVNSSEACVNDDGWGYASDGASRCAPGFYSWKGSRRPCQQCPPGRTTLDNPNYQRTIEDCRVAPGHGIVGANNGTDAFDVDTSALNATQLAALPVLECPIGYYGLGNATGAKCQKCDGTSTLAAGSASAAACVVCFPGYGRKTNASSAPCEICEFGTWQNGEYAQCQQCPDSAFYAPVDGAGATYVSAGTSFFRGATRIEDCVAKKNQLAPEAGQAFFAPDNAAVQALLTATSKPKLDDCLAACPADQCCLAQYDAASGACKTALLAPAAADAASGLQLLYKLPPSGPAAAALSLGRRSKGAAPADGGSGSGGQPVGARSMSSGWYATCAVPAAQAAAWQTAGSSLGADARTFATAAAWDMATTRKACKAKCDDSNVCFGFLYDAASGACLYRGGVDALASRAFFALPTNVDLVALKWAAGAPGGAR